MRSSRDLPDRFCWRERVEPINWRLISSIDINKIIAQRDTATLERLSLHLTFCKLPRSETSVTHGRPQLQEDGHASLWDIIRILQLSLEYIFYLRSQDAIDVNHMMRQTREQELEKDCLRECIIKKKRACKKLRQEKKQFHQVMQHICVLLEAHGSSPSAFEAIERIILDRFGNYPSIKDPLDGEEMQHNDYEEKDTYHPHVENVQQCEICGKVFLPGNYLSQHIMRRHSSSRTPRLETNKSEERRNGNERCTSNDHNLDKEENDDIFKGLLQRIEEVTQEKMDAIQQEATRASEKFDQINEMLSNEQSTIARKNAIVNNLDAKVMAATHELQNVAEKRAKLATEVEDLAQQVDFLKLRKSMLIKEEPLVSSELLGSGTDTNVELFYEEPNPSEEKLEQLEPLIHKLQEELKTAQREITITIDEKYVLLAELEQLRAQDAERQAKLNKVVPYAESDNDAAKVQLLDASTQTTHIASIQEDKSIQVGDASSQAEVCEDAIMNFSSSSESEVERRTEVDSDVGLLDISSDFEEMVIASPYKNDETSRINSAEIVSFSDAQQVSADEVNGSVRSSAALQHSLSQKLSTDQTARIHEVLNTFEKSSVADDAPDVEAQLRDRVHEWESKVNARLQLQCMNTSIDAACRMSHTQSANIQRVFNAKSYTVSSIMLKRMSDYEKKLEQMVSVSSRGSLR